MTSERDRAARAVRDLYADARARGAPADSAGTWRVVADRRTGEPHFFRPTDRHAIYVRRRAFGPLAIAQSFIPSTLEASGVAVDLISFDEARTAFRDAASQPDEVSYVAVFDLASPLWMVPVLERPVQRPTAEAHYPPGWSAQAAPASVGSHLLATWPEPFPCHDVAYLLDGSDASYPLPCYDFAYPLY